MLKNEKLPVFEFYLQWFIIPASITFLYNLSLFGLNFQHDSKNKNIIKKQAAQFGLWLGQSTTKFAQLSHGPSLAEGQEILLSLKDACQNIICFGGIGSGKTSRLIHVLLLQLLNQDFGGLIFDIKANFHQTVIKIADALGKGAHIIKLGIGGQHLNII